METLQLGNVKLTWLVGGVTHMDGGAMFGVVPKPLWSKKYPHNERNQIELRTDPILIQANGINYLLESGIGYGKLTDKQKRNYGVTEESQVKESLEALRLTTADIHYVLMTHMHFDHACGLTEQVNANWVSTFPNAHIITSEIEWNEMRQPNIRSANTYWKENWQAIEAQVQTFESIWKHGPLKLIHTGGHSDGHAVLVIKDNGETLIHMADLMPTHAHQNPLWVLAYDDYPMDSIESKQHWLKFGLERNAWFSFYHDAMYRALKWDENFQITDSIHR